MNFKIEVQRVGEKPDVSRYWDDELKSQRLKETAGSPTKMLVEIEIPPTQVKFSQVIYAKIHEFMSRLEKETNDN